MYKSHRFINSDPTQFDSNCLTCGGKDRDSIHHPENVEAAICSLVGAHAAVNGGKRRYVIK